MPAKSIRMGAVQTRIMRVLWKHGEAPARQLTEELNAQRPIAHSTVQTLLRKLEVKGTVAHENRAGTFFFYALVTEEQVLRSATKELLSRAFEGSAYGLMAQVVKNEKISRRELKLIRKLIEEKEAEK